MRYKCIVSYDGSAYSGWQIQKGYKTIQQEIQSAISKIACQEIKIYGAGRTDSHVHALGQCFHFDLEKQFKDIRMAINSQLPNDIYIREVEIVEESFHSRYSAFYKHYDYLVNDGQYNPLLRNYCFQLNKKLDIELMKEAVEVLIGTHDFTSFNATSLQEVADQSRTIYQIDITREADMVKLSFYGDGFLRYMVRILSRCLIEVGLANLSIEQLKMMLFAKNKQVCSYNCPAEGLYLIEVGYTPY
ncbi:MAG: tRNA pseudouridine(38-40) synthase TruA [Erysipelotrichaceae bacterium]